jgi:hypothetical protein
MARPIIIIIPRIEWPWPASCSFRLLRWADLSLKRRSKESYEEHEQRTTSSCPDHFSELQASYPLARNNLLIILRPLFHPNARRLSSCYGSEKRFIMQSVLKRGILKVRLPWSDQILSHRRAVCQGEKKSSPRL